MLTVGIPKIITKRSFTWLNVRFFELVAGSFRLVVVDTPSFSTDFEKFNPVLRFIKSLGSVKCCYYFRRSKIDVVLVPNRHLLRDGAWRKTMEPKPGNSPGLGPEVVQRQRVTKRERHKEPVAGQCRMR